MEVGSSAIHEEPQSLKEPTADPAVAEEAWNMQNLLSLDGGGVRGYWTLLCLKRLMERIAAMEEKSEDEDSDVDGNAGPISASIVDSSFSPENYPPNVSHVPLAKDEITKERAARDTISKNRSIKKSRRYLPCHYFDYIGGSSTGALIAIMLGRFRMTVLDCILEYKNLGGEVFGRPRFWTELHFLFGVHRTKYDANKLKRVIEDVTRRRIQGTEQIQPATTFPSQQYLCRTFVTTLVTENPRNTMASLYLIRSYNHYLRNNVEILREPYSLRTDRINRRSTTMSTQSRGQRYQRTQNPPQVRPANSVNYGDAQNLEIWQVARAATAAPWYFDSFKIGEQVFEDGGFGYTNNPTELGVFEIEEASGAESVGIVVSVGTARKDKPAKKNIVSKVKSKINIATDPGLIHKQMLGKTGQLGLKGMSYHRLNPTDEADEEFRLDIELDEWSPRTSRFRLSGESGSKTIKEIEDKFYRWIAKHWVSQAFDRCAAELVECRRARTGDRAKWERYATAAEFTCRRCHKGEEKFYHRGKFEDHIKREHQGHEAKLTDEVEQCKKVWVYRPCVNGR